MQWSLTSPSAVVVVLVKINNRLIHNMNTCMSCARQHDSWRAYCTNCMQTQTLVKQMEEAERRRNFNSPASQPLLPSNFSGYGGYSEPSRFSWLMTNGLGALGLVCWMFYMLWTFFTGANFTAMDFVAGLVFFIWYGNEY
jgi:hypothetical protein